MSKLNVFALFGMLFLSSILLGSGMYSTNQVFSQENQTGTENEAKIKADIEQENKCKKDTECENENELNNQLDITTITGQQSTSLTVKKEIFGCDNIQGDDNDIAMNCEIQNDSPEWLSCADSNNSPLFETVCQNIEEGFFDIEVLDGQNAPIKQFTGSAQGTTIEGIEPGTYLVNEIKHPFSNPPFPSDQLLDSGISEGCKDLGFSDGGLLLTQNPFFLYSICFEYEDEQGNDCSQTTVNAGENKVCTVKNHIIYSRNTD